MLARLRAHLLLPAAAALTVLLTASVLAALTAFGATLGDSGLRHRLERQAADDAVIDVHAAVTAGERADADASVRSALRRAYGGLPTEVFSATRSASYALPRPDDAPPAREENPDLTLFTSLDRERVRMTDGVWPSGAGRPGPGGTFRVPVAVPALAAERLGLEPGDALRVASRLDGPPPVRAEITGVYVPKDRSDPYWRLDPLGGEAVRTLSYTTYGPLAVSDAAFGAERLTPDATHWQADADFSALTTDRVDELRTRVAATAADFDAASGVDGAVASSDLPQVLTGLQRSLLVGRSTLLVAGLQLAALAGLTLLLVTRLLATDRREETTLLRARGGSRGRVAAGALLEGLLVALPGLVLGPLLAGPLARTLAAGSGSGPGGSGDALRLPGTVWWVSAAVALGCALTAAAPGFLGSADVHLASRRPRAAALLRGGADVALLVVAGVALWQLARRSAGAGVLAGGGPDGGPATADGGAVAGSSAAAGIDPVLVTAPALALVAVTVPALRVLPLVVRLGERAAARGRGLTAALAGWQLGRRPARGAGPALLLVLAVAMGVFAVGQGASWDRSQADQAAFRVGADVSVSGSGTPAFGQGGLFDDVDGIAAVAPVNRTTFGVGGDLDAEIVATDAGEAGRLLHLRGDLADRQPEDLAALLDGPGRRSGGLELPADATALRLELRLRAPGPEPVDATVALAVEDRFGVPYRFRVGDLPADGRTHTLTAAFDEAAGDRGVPAGPLRLTGLTAAHVAPTRSGEQRLTVEELRAETPGGTRAVEAAGGAGWSARATAGDTGERLGVPMPDRPQLRSLRTGDDTGGGTVTVAYTTGAAEEPPSFAYPAVPVDVVLTLPGAAPPKGPLPAVATDAFLRAAGAEVGDEVLVQISQQDVPVRVTGALRALPTTGADGGTASAAGGDAAGEGGGGALLVDLAALDARLLAAGTAPLEPEGWWVDATPGASPRIADALRAHTPFDAVDTREELTERLRDDPLGSGPRAALTGIAVAAALLAATGFAVSTAATARERRDEFAVLRALGAPRSRLARALAAEQGVLVLLSLTVGVVLGVVVTRLVVPLIVLTERATTPVPPLLVRIPPEQVALLVGALVLVCLLVIAVSAARGAEPARALRAERGD
ncbi:ABC transporter permease [Streptomyces sp. DSM 42041]|uniref:ABC transporter permease n=1 Tax=Streptomyces hazeniae TaxID=3075538 RepID=A0ABU2NLL1_9ACTN|nr:ABC transporter permease [Streptomyces sp. DSM 42041]MDT0377644.1 ABC transporter permease [Streptomyces sp. DSM 42041]